MRRLLPCLPVLLFGMCMTTRDVRAEPAQPIELATFDQSRRHHSEIANRQVETIRKIVLNQGDDARALANLVQLSRNLSPTATSALYFELSSDYLLRAKYNQAASVLQQLLNQHRDQPIARDALLRLVRLYSSGEVQHTEGLKQSTQPTNADERGFARYAMHTANVTVQQLPTLAEDPALTFQRAVATRHVGQQRAALGRLTRLKRDLQGEPWRTRALAEQWLHDDRRDEPPLAVVHCPRIDQRPHLDGSLDEPCWQANSCVRFAYDHEFLYLAITCEKKAAHDYQTDSRVRSYDADLSAHDHIEIHLDVDRDYATWYELAIDHRGWTSDRCWLNPGWNPKWFVAADADESHWTAEAAIPLTAIVHSAPSSGAAWAIATRRILPSADEPSSQEISLLLFE
ncbi:MAG: hypothetical protein AAGD11_03645 [Planctomycetota bacterium]